MKSKEINILLKEYNLIEYVSLHNDNFKKNILRVENQNLRFEFKLEEVDNIDYKLNEYIEIDSFFNIVENGEPIDLYVCTLKKDTTIVRYKCGYNIYKISKNKVYAFYNRKWNIEADFDLLPTPSKKCYENSEFAPDGELLINLPDKEDLILREISHTTSGLEIFSFVKCLPTSTSSIRYKYVKKLGCVEFEMPDLNTFYKLRKIDNEVIDI